MRDRPFSSRWREVPSRRSTRSEVSIRRFVCFTMAMLAAQDAQTRKPTWPSLLQGPIFVDHPSGVPQKAGEEYILWDN